MPNRFESILMVHGQRARLAHHDSNRIDTSQQRSLRSANMLGGMIVDMIDQKTNHSHQFSLPERFDIELSNARPTNRRNRKRMRCGC